MFVDILNHSKFLVCLSVFQLAYFFTENRLIQVYIQFWRQYLSENCFRHSQDFSGLFPIYSEFLVCLSVCQLVCFLTEMRHIKGYLKLWIRYLSSMLVHQFQTNLNFSYICHSVSQLTSVCLFVCLLPYQTQPKGYLQFRMRYLSEIFWRHS